MGNSESTSCRSGVDEEAEAEASFQAYIRPARVELYNRFRLRALRNPYFLRRTLSYRSAEPSPEQCAFRLSLSISGSATAPAPQQAGGQSPACIFAALCVAQPSSTSTADAAAYRVERAWRVGAPASSSSSTAGCNTVLVTLPPGVQSGQTGLHLVLFAWSGQDAGPSLRSSSGTAVYNGLRGSRVFGLVQNGARVLWCCDVLERFWPEREDRTDGVQLDGRIELSPALLHGSAEVPSSESGALPPGASALQACVLSMEPTAAGDADARVLHFRAEGVEPVEPALSPDGGIGAERATEANRALSTSPGRVWFHFLYANNMRRRSEVTDRFSCPFCTLACTSFQGLQEHLHASHDKFSYTFSDPASSLPTVNVSCWPHSAGGGSTGGLSSVTSPLSKEFRFQSRRYGVLQTSAIARLSAKGAVFGSGAQPSVLCKRKHNDVTWQEEGVSDDSGPADGAAATPKLARPSHGMKRAHHNTSPPTGDATRSRMLTRTRPPPKLLKPPQAQPALTVGDHVVAGKFFHARTAVVLHPSELEDACIDSDDDVDEEHWEANCRRGIDEFGDVTKTEKDFMFLWNTFIHKRRIFADALLADAAAEFASMHSAQLRGDAELRRCFTLHLINLWESSLLDGGAVNDALLKLEGM